MPTARWDLSIGVVGGRLYAVGGGFHLAPDIRTVEEFDPATDVWGSRAPVPIGVGACGAAGVGGTLFVVGGVTTDQFGGHFINANQAYNPETDTWRALAPMPTPRAGLGVAVLDGLLYAAGGFTGPPFGVVGALEVYDPKTNTWVRKAAMSTPRLALGFVQTGGLLFALGGEAPVGSTEVLLRSVEAYDARTNAWAERSLMPFAVAGGAVGAVGGVIYVVGGADASGRALQTVEVYDPQTDTWTVAPEMPTARSNLAAAVVEDTLYAVGGTANGTVALATNEAFSPFLAVNIDIKPGDANNVINLKAGGVVPVAILGSATFDPKTVEPSTVTFAGAHVAKRPNGTLMTTVADVNHDGYPDLVLYFRTQDLMALAPAVAAISPSPSRSAGEDGATSPSGTPVGTSALHENAGLKARATGSPLGTALQQTRDGKTPPLQQVEAVLYGKTYSGTPIRGSGMVELVPPSHPANSPRR